MPPRHCCCETCELGADDFRRDNSNPPTGNWHVIGGEWKIESNELISVSPGPLATTICHPSQYALGSARIRVRLKNITGGRTYIMRAGDPQGSLDITITFTGSPGPDNGSVEVTVQGQTTETEVYDWAEDAPDNGVVTICYAPGFYLSASGPQNVITDTPSDIELDAGDRWVTSLIETTAASSCHTIGSASVGNFAFVQGDFDDFVYEVELLENPDCATCDCTCDDEFGRQPIPKSLTATITNINECSPLAGSYTLTQQLSEVPIGETWDFNEVDKRTTAEKQMWVSSKIACAHLTDAEKHFHLMLVCVPNGYMGRPSFRLLVVSSGTRINDGTITSVEPFIADPADPDNDQPNTLYADMRPKSGSTCDPIDLTFPILQTSHNTNEQGNYCCADFGNLGAGTFGKFQVRITE